MKQRLILWESMIKGCCETIDVMKALARFGGFVRYYDSTEPLSDLADIICSGPCRRMMACCGGGDQVLTMLGVPADVQSLCAVDINAAQLFVLAGKARFLEQRKAFPTFEQLASGYPGRIAAVKKDIRDLGRMPLLRSGTGKVVNLPEGFGKHYSLVVDDSMFVFPESGPFWKNDPLVIERIRDRISRLEFAHIDIFDSPQYFRSGTLDLIYLSDIHWQEDLAYYRAKLAALVELLCFNGRIVTYLDSGDHYLGQGISPGRMLLQHAQDFSLRVGQHKRNGYLVLERMEGR